VTDTGAKPWYREFWLWFILAPLIATVIGGFATLIIAGAPPALVVDDFGQIAMAVERDQARDRRAAEMGLAAELRMTPGVDTQDQAVRVTLNGDSPAGLWLQLIHPTREDLDQKIPLERAEHGYDGTAARPDTRVYVQITDAGATWRLTGELQPGQQAIELLAGARR
jgi:hypothetical protein